ncbi:Uncharacterised protein [Mycobacteroides abscessus subsp. abscessus]|nr:Uncharacterised protein [Mycobacteroides abscessus subsp. abscessus]
MKTIPAMGPSDFSMIPATPIRSRPDALPSVTMATNVAANSATSGVPIVSKIRCTNDFGLSMTTSDNAFANISVTGSKMVASTATTLGAGPVRSASGAVAVGMSNGPTQRSAIRA